MTMPPTTGPTTILSFQLDNELSRTAGAGNNKAALVGILTAIAQLELCEDVFWGAWEGNWRRVAVFIGWHRDVSQIGRPALPLDRIRPFLGRRISLYDVMHVLEVDFHMPFSKWMGRSSTGVELEIGSWQSNRAPMPSDMHTLFDEALPGFALVSTEEARGPIDGALWKQAEPGAGVWIDIVKKENYRGVVRGWWSWGSKAELPKAVKPDESYGVVLNRFQVPRSILQAWRKSAEMKRLKEEGIGSEEEEEEEENDEDGWLLVDQM